MLLLIFADRLPVFNTHIQNCPLSCDKSGTGFLRYMCLLHWPIISFFLLLLFSLFCSSVLWRCCVWAWTSFSSSSTPSGFAAEDVRRKLPHTPILTPSSPVQTAAAPLGASSSPRWSAGERLNDWSLFLP